MLRCPVCHRDFPNPGSQSKLPAHSPQPMMGGLCVGSNLSPVDARTECDRVTKLVLAKFKEKFKKL